MKKLAIISALVAVVILVVSFSFGYITSQQQEVADLSPVGGESQPIPPKPAPVTPVPVKPQALTSAATLTLSPASQSVAVGGTFTVNILLNTGGQVTYGVDISRLRFNPAILQVVDTDAANVGVQITAGTLMSSTIVSKVDNKLGTIQFSQIASPGISGPVLFNGSGTLATITFKAVAPGISNTTIDFTRGSGSDSNVAGTKGDILSSVGNGVYTVH